MEGPGFPDHRHELEGEVTSARCSFSTRDHPSAPRPSFGGNFTACFHSPASREVCPPASLLHLASPPPRVGAGHSFSWGQGYNNNRTGRKITGGQGQVRVGVKKDAGACVGLHRTHSFKINLFRASGEGPSTPLFICSFTTKVALTCIF